MFTAYVYISKTSRRQTNIVWEYDAIMQKNAIRYLFSKNHQRSVYRKSIRMFGNEAINVKEINIPVPWGHIAGKSVEMLFQLEYTKMQSETVQFLCISKIFHQYYMILLFLHQLNNTLQESRVVDLLFMNVLSCYVLTTISKMYFAKWI